MLLELQVTTEGDRLDRWLTQELSDWSRSRLQRLIDEGLVSVNGKVVTEKKTKLKVGDRLELKIPPPQPLDLQPEAIPLDILYEDDQLLIVNKPAGLVVHPAPGHENGTLVNALLHHCPNLPGIGEVKRPGIVHRLDKDTTGAIVVAKTDLAYQHLQGQIQAKTARREYLGIVFGAPHTSEGIIDTYIGRHPVDRQKMAVLPSAKTTRRAITAWQVIERLGNYSLLKFQLETGRTHQIRVHSSYLGHPLVGDKIYGTGGKLKVKLTGQALHAYSLTISHPISGEIIQAIAPLPEEFEKLLAILRKRS